MMMADQQESVEERLASWRHLQQQKYENQSALDAANPRDDDGRMKLLASVSKGSISLFFFILMWRSVHHFELADQSFKGSTRLVMVLPTVLLFLGNMVGCVATLMTAAATDGRKNKKRMKAVLNLNKLVEITLMAYNIMRLIFFPNRYVMREIYVGRTLSNFLFIIQCQLFTKVTWGAAQMKQELTGGTDYATNGLEYEDDANYTYGNNNNNNQYSDAYGAQQQHQQHQMQHEPIYGEQENTNGAGGRGGQW